MTFVWIVAIIALFILGVHLCTIGMVTGGVLLIIVSVLFGFATIGLVLFAGQGGNPFR